MNVTNDRQPAVLYLISYHFWATRAGIRPGSPPYDQTNSHYKFGHRVAFSTFHRIILHGNLAPRKEHTGWCTVDVTPCDALHTIGSFFLLI